MRVLLGANLVLQAISHDADNCLAQFGLAQCLLQRNQRDDCIACLEKILKRYPDDAATLRILGTLLARMVSHEREGVCSRS